jgi:hypothetical protein
MYWSSTKAPHNIFDRPIPDDVAEFLHRHRGIAAAILAGDLKVQAARVQAWRRRLNLLRPTLK